MTEAMKTFDHPDVVLREVARLVNLWAEHEWSAATVDMFVEWADRSAGATPHVPMPLPAAKALVAFGLCESNSQGELTPIRRLRELQVSPIEPIDKFHPHVAILVFERAFSVPPCSRLLSKALGFAEVHADRQIVRWRKVSKECRSNPAWLWLQQLGLAKHEGDSLELDTALRAFIIATPVGRRKQSKEELLARLKAQAERSEWAEEYVVRLEKERLIEYGEDVYADGVRRISEDDVGAGYDVFSYELDGKYRYVEVKSSVGARKFFVLTQNEYRNALKKGDRYLIAWVSNAEALPDGDCPVVWFRNPAELLKRGDSPWETKWATMTVTRVGDDEPFQEDTCFDN